MLKKRIIITGGTGLLGRHFYKKYKDRYLITRYPHRIEKFKKFEKWLTNKKFNYFIHFAAITKNESKKFKKIINLINVKSPINILKIINKKEIEDFSYFLFISSSHVYGYSKDKIKESKKRNPQNVYGKTKKKVEDYIINNRKKFSFKIGIARVFNSTGYKQKKGNFVPDMLNKMKKQTYINHINQYRDFIHINDISRSINLILLKKIEDPINVCTGKKTNLIKACKILNKLYIRKKITYGKKIGKNLVGDNLFLKKIGIKRFKGINEILSSYKK